MSRKKVEDIAIAIGSVSLMLVISAFASFTLILFTGTTLDYRGMFLATRIFIFLASGVTILSYAWLFRDKPIKFLNNTNSEKQKIFGYLLSIGLLMFLVFIIGQHKITNALELFVFGFLLTAIAEELMFRGLVEYRLENSFQPWQVIIIQAIIFAFLGHQGFDFISNVIIRIPLGIILSLVKRASGSYIPAIVAHFVYDSAIYVL